MQPFNLKQNGMTQYHTIKYTVKLLANEEERYKAQNTVRLLTHEWFPVDVFFKTI